MTVYLGSRYEGVPVVSALDADGLLKPTLFRTPPPTPVRFASYLVVVGDRLDRLAYRFYQRSDFWWVIADANPEVLLSDPLTPGTMIRIPYASDIS